jgi:hypothetical protein
MDRNLDFRSGFCFFRQPFVAWAADGRLRAFVHNFGSFPRGGSLLLMAFSRKIIVGEAAATETNPLE